MYHQPGVKWGPVEDAAILGWVSRYGAVQWNKLIQTQLPHRTQNEVRDRHKILAGVKETGRASQWSLALFKQGRSAEQVEGGRDFGPPKLRQNWKCAFCSLVFPDYGECEVNPNPSVNPGGKTPCPKPTVLWTVQLLSNHRRPAQRVRWAPLLVPRTIRSDPVPKPGFGAMLANSLASTCPLPNLALPLSLSAILV